MADIINLSELRDIGFELGIDPEDMRHSRRRELVLDLLRYVDTEGRSHDLFSILRREYPTEDWPQHFVFPKGALASAGMTFPIIQIGFTNAKGGITKPVLESSIGLTGNTLLLEVAGFSEPDVKELIAAERDALRSIYLEYTEGSQEQEADTAQLSVMRALQIFPKSQQQYDKECESYLEDFSDYLLEKATFDLYKARYREIDFLMENLGSAAADDILVEVYFPDEFVFLPEDRIQDELEEPVPPSRPNVNTSLFEQIRFPQLFAPDLSLITPRAIYDLPSVHGNVQGPYIEKSNSTKVSYEVAKLIPKAPGELLGKVGFIVHPAATGKTWHLKYRIFARQLSEPILGELYLEVRSYPTADA